MKPMCCISQAVSVIVIHFNKVRHTSIKIADYRDSGQQTHTLSCGLVGKQ